MANESCETCCFWQSYPKKDESDPGEGLCARYPPVPVSCTRWPESGGEPYIGVITDWPETGCDDWCGEWRPDDSKNIS